MSSRGPIAYLILAHDEPEHLCRLIRRLSAPFAHFFIHLDRKSDAARFRHCASLPRVTFIERLPVYWGGWSHVEATLLLIDASRKSGLPFSSFVLLSGTHFPIRGNDEIHVHLTSGSQHITLNQVPCPHKPMWRFDRYHFEGAYRRPRLHRLLPYAATKAASLVRIDPARKLPGITLFAGSAYWALSSDALAWIEEFIRDRPEVTRYFRHTFVPDESFFHTIIANSPFRASCAGTTTFADWNNPNEQPAFIGFDHLQFLLGRQNPGLPDGGPALFARKFGQRNADVVDRIEAHLDCLTEEAIEG